MHLGFLSDTSELKVLLKTFTNVAVDTRNHLLSNIKSQVYGAELSSQNAELVALGS